MSQKHRVQRDSITPAAALASVRGKMPLLAHSSAKNTSGSRAAVPSWCAEPRKVSKPEAAK